MKILLALERESDAEMLSRALEALGHRTVIGSGLDQCAELLHQCQPGMIVADERLRRDQPESGLRLAELCRLDTEGNRSSCGMRALVLLPVADWGRMRRAQTTGANVVVKGSNFEAVIRCIESIADNLVTDRVLGPVLLGIHRFQRRRPDKLCTTCKWEAASVRYGTSEADVDLTPVRTAILNALFGVRRGQSATEIAWMVNNGVFLRSILKGRLLKESAIKMEITRIRDGITKALQAIGAPYDGRHFLPLVPHGVERYRLAANWAVRHCQTHITSRDNAHTAIASSEEGR